MNSPTPIIIEINNKNVHLFYNIDFIYFKDEMSKIAALEFVDSYCFEGILVLGINVNCDNMNTLIIIKRFFNFFIYRWKIDKSEIKTIFDYKLNFLDYQHS